MIIGLCVAWLDDKQELRREKQDIEVCTGRFFFNTKFKKKKLSNDLERRVYKKLCYKSLNDIQWLIAVIIKHLIKC